VQVRLLGPVDLMVRGAARPVPGLRRRAVLAALALQPGRVLAADHLINVVWGGAAPATATNTLQSHVSQLRRFLGRDAIVARPPGYLLDLAGQSTDVQAAERLIGEAGRAADPRDAAARLSDAVGLWRGQPLADLAGLAWFDDHARRLELVLLQARAALGDLRLAAGEHAVLVPELEALSRQYPLDERIHGQLMLALYRSGRQTDALEVYRRLRRTLDEDLAMRPGQRVRDLEAAILRQDPSLDLPAGPVSGTSTSVAAAQRAPGGHARPEQPVQAPHRVVPAQLPPGLHAFTGRTEELARLDELLDRSATSPSDHAIPARAIPAHDPTRPVALVITAVSGTAGVGKTTLAVHWAHRVADRFPDGQLYVNLRGFDPGGTVVDPATAVRGFLDALEVRPERIPADPAAQAALYRSLTAGKRMLVVLDNARDEEQVRPLLPGSSSCLVVVTSRNQLTGLVASEAAHQLTLDVLSTVESRRLLAGRLGAGTVAAQPFAVDRIIAACARLPLALAVAAARAKVTGFPLATLAAQLDDAGGRLDVLDAGDTMTRVRAVFSWSYAALTPDAARLFRLLGLSAGPDISVPAAASLAGQAPREVRSLLAELVRANLLTDHGPGRYSFHDLLRGYATELAHLEPPDVVRAARLRVFDHYVHTAVAADRMVDPARDPMPVPLGRASRGTRAESPADQPAAMRWLSTERHVLLATLRQAGDTGFDTHAWQLAWGLDRLLDRRGHWLDLISAWRGALGAARRLGDVDAQAVAHRLLGSANIRLGLYDDAHHHLGHALDLFARAANQTGLVYAYRDRAILWERQGRPDRALDDAEQALLLSEAATHRAQAYALNAVGWCRAQLGDHARAVGYCQRALALHQQLGDLAGQAATWDSLGYAHDHLGHHAVAIDCYEQALAIYRQLSYNYYQATTLLRLGDTHHAAGSTTAARGAWEAALDILTELHHPDADAVRAKLRETADCPALCG
jgi:DNA-binding SARP family transcriptional activator/tetratricopeptide (TPR) repeat protein